MSSHKPQKFNKNKSDRPPKPPGVGKRIRDTERLLKVRYHDNRIYFAILWIITILYVF